MAGLGTQHADAQDPGTRHGGRAAQELKRSGPALLAAAGFAITIAAFYPGLVTVDSIAQYEQVLAGAYNDHHPALMAWLWSRIDPMLRGPAGMLMLHAGLLWSALLLFAQGARRRGIRHAWVLLLAGLFPPILGIAGEIWKDVAMATSLLFATAILYRASAGGAPVRWPAASVALAAIFYATAIRANAPAATGPIVVYWAYCVFPQVSLRTVLRIGIGVVLALLVVNWGIDARLLHVRRVHLAQMLEAFDIAAIHCAGGDATIPRAFVRRDAQALPICEGFDSSQVDLMYFGPRSPLQLDTDRSALRELAQAWRRAVIASPGKYLAHRARAFASLLGFGVPDAQRLLWSPFSIENVYGFVFAPNAVTAAIGAGVAICTAAGFYNGLVWLMLALAVAVFAWRHRREDVTCEATLAVSAVCYTLAYFFVALAPDYRYLYWTIMAATVAVLLSVIRTDAFAAFVCRVADARRHAPRWPLVVLAGFGFAVTLAAYRPGLLTFDSILQFSQSQDGLYWDHHPPLMAWTWGVVSRAIPGPVGMLLLQAALMWLGLLLFADGAARRGLRHAWSLIAIGFLPPIIGIEGEIWKDVQMAAALLFAAGLVYRASAGRERVGGIVAALSLAALFYATAVRANAPAATGPVLVYWAHQTFRRLSWRASLLAGATALMLLLGAQWIFENRFLHVEHAHVSQFLEIHDIAAIECAGGDASIPTPPRRVAVGARALCDAFDPLQVAVLFAGAGAPLAASTDVEVIHALGREWRRAIVANPSLYLRHRLRIFGALMGEGVDDARRLVWSPSSIANRYGFTFTPNAITDAIGAGVGVARALGLYNGILWLAVAIAVLLAGALRMRRDRHCDAAALSLAASAIAYTLPYFLVAVAPDFRYLYWTIVATAVGAMLALLPARRALRGQPPIAATPLA